MKQIKKAKNPYFINKKPIMLESYCVYLDILGFKEEQEQSFNKRTEVKLLEQLYIILKDNKKMFAPVEGDDTKFFVYKIFTDNIIIGCPYQDTVESETQWGLLVIYLCIFQLNLALNGFFVRGGFSCGKIHISENIVYGTAILEAYKLENEQAIYPRIILSPNVIGHVKKHMNFYAHKEDAPQSTELLIDVDGKYFFNYLYCIIDENDGGAITWSKLERHRTLIEGRLKQYKNNSHIWQKYYWLANYHNFFCEKHASGYKNYSSNYMISNKLLLLKPKSILQETE